MENKIIQPAHNKIASPCPSWKAIKQEAMALREFIEAGQFEGRYSSAFAISHAQVSNDPLRFFVVSDKYKNGSLIKWFGSWCIMNLIIIKQSDLISWEEACMSFAYRKPKRIDRWNKVTVEYYIPFLWTWRRIRRKLTGLPAFIVQHETEHENGENMYGLQ